MNDKKIAKVEYGNPELSHVFAFGDKQKNISIELTEDDLKCKTVIYCNEAYAPSLFAEYAMRSGQAGTVAKDARPGDSIKVKALSYNMGTKIVNCEGIGSGMMVEVPFSEFIYDLNSITNDFVFDVVVTRLDGGAYSATCKNPKKYREELEDAHRGDAWFDVKITNLIRGGYRALYKDTIECFIPGSHAAANVVKDFQQLIGKVVPVMVDNYDWSSRMYVVSYKKYVKQSLPVKIHDIKFGHKYAGTLTSNPTEFGLFIEFENYYTGLLHRVDLENYDDICKQYKAGSGIDVYVKNVTEKKGNYRIILSLSDANTDKEKMTWQKLKTTCENKTIRYSHEPGRRSIIVTLDSGENINISLPADFNTETLKEYDKIIIKDVNVLRQEVKFDFYK